jgi:hypothetical protein
MNVKGCVYALDLMEHLLKEMPGQRKVNLA